MGAINHKVFKDFFFSKSAGGIILLLCVSASLLIANTSLGSPFEKILGRDIGTNFGNITLRYPLLLWINDGLMAVFFLLVGLEIKRELIEGELSSLKQASLPIIAAVGGMLVPALFFLLFNAGTSTAGGWGIPMATDIAFAIAVLSLLGNKVPTALKVFLAALAIVDDLGAILVIALFYSSGIHSEYLFYAACAFAVMVILNRLKVMNYIFYLLPGMFLWYFIHHSGIHATIAGVLTAFTVPTTPDSTESPLEKLEHLLTRLVNFFIMPIFALANTNIRLDGEMFTGIYSNMGIGIMAGLLIGKPVGIFTASWLAVKSGLSRLPQGVKWTQVLGMGILGGIGFTMSIFIAMLSYKDAIVQTEAKFVILFTSVFAGLLGYLLLKVTYLRQKRQQVAEH